MLEGLFLAVAEAVFSYTIDKLDPAEQIKKWLKREPSRLAFQKALSRAYIAFARQYPDYVASLFDKSFLAGKGASELAKLLTRHLHPDPALFAQAWGASIGFDINSQFCKDATKPAADFLKWLEAELKSEAVFGPIFDSRALESLPNLEDQIEKLTTELKRGFAAALKNAKDYEKIVLEIGGDVDGSIVIGDNNQVSVSNVYNHYHTGAFATLNDYYIPPDAVFQRVRVDEFVGRDWLTAKVDEFLNEPRNKSGIFLLVGEAGVGKTSFIARLVKERRYLHLFAEQVPGDANLQRALQSLGSQLVTRFQIDTYKDRDTLTQLAAFPDFLDKLLRLAVHTLTKDEKIVIVCDALDEAGTAPDGNVFGLPNVLPDNVYFILSQRPISTKLPNVNTQTETLEAQGSENLQDMDDYLIAVMKRPEVAGQLRSKNYSEQFFVQTLKEKSLGVWMYLHYILEEIKKGSRAPLELESLPTGLVGYYADYWNDWREGKNGRGESIQKWDEIYAPLLTTLAVAQEPIAIEQLIAWAGIQAGPREVTRLLQENWRSFLTIRESENRKTYRPYHASFKDFLTGNVDISQLRPSEKYLVQELAEQSKEAHQRIVKVFKAECNEDWQVLVARDYPRLHLTYHLASAGEFEALISLLTEGNEHIAWAEARYQKEETYAGFMNDLAHIWKFAQERKNFALLIRCMLIETSIRSLAQNIPPILFYELAKTGVWSYPRCLTTIRQIPDSRLQYEAIRGLAQGIPKELLEETKSLVREIKDEYFRAYAFAALARHLNDELKKQVVSEALSAAYAITNESRRAFAFAALAPHLSDQLNMELLSAAREIKDESVRARAFAALAPHLNDELKKQVVSEALSAAYVITNESARSYAFADLAPYLNNELKTQVVSEALSAARAIKDKYYCAISFAYLTSHLNDELKAQVVSEALSVARVIKGEYLRASAFAWLAPHLNDELNIELLSAARDFKDESARASAFAALAPHLNDELNIELLSAARDFTNESDRAEVLSALVPHLNDELKTQVVSEALSAARAIKDVSARAEILSALAPYLNDELKTQVVSEALSVARAIKDEYNRAIRFAALVPHLNDELKTQVVSEALSVARAITEEFSRASAFAALVPHLNDELNIELLSAARDFTNESDRAKVLCALVPHLNNELKTQVVSEALSAARAITEEFSRARAFAWLAPHLNDELKAQVVAEALSAAYAITEEFARASAFAALVPHLNDELNIELLSAARDFKDESARARAFAALVPHLNDQLNIELLSAARDFTNESDRAEVLSALAPYFYSELKVNLLTEALLGSTRMHEIKKILTEWKNVSYQGLQKTLMEFMKRHSINNRAWGLYLIDALIPSLTYFEGEDIVIETLSAIRDTARWWP